NGVAVSEGFTVLHARSVAEDVRYVRNGVAFDGEVQINAGSLATPGVALRGRSLLHSSALSTEAFAFGFFGDWGRYIVSFSLMLFAFSTAISWSYYGDRAMTYLIGTKGVLPFRIVFCLGFFWAAV